jgi:hypothetical protein
MGNDLQCVGVELSCLPEGAREELLGLTGKTVQ